MILEALADLGIRATPWMRHYPLGIITMTPRVANQMLDHAPEHRRDVSRPELVDVYANQMATGRWLYTGQPVQFNDLGHQIDGNHRLHAVLQSDWIGPMAVALDLPVAAAWVMNEPGKPRCIDGHSP